MARYLYDMELKNKNKKPFNPAQIINFIPIYNHPQLTNPCISTVIEHNTAFIIFHLDFDPCIQNTTDHKRV